MAALQDNVVIVTGGAPRVHDFPHAGIEIMLREVCKLIVRLCCQRYRMIWH